MVDETVITFSVVDGVRVVSIGNEVDGSNAETLQRYLDGAAADETTLVLSLAQCRRADASGLFPILRLAERIGEKFYAVVTPHTQVRRAFELAGLDGRLNVCDTLEDALAQANEKPCLV